MLSLAMVFAQIVLKKKWVSLIKKIDKKNCNIDSTEWIIKIRHIYYKPKTNKARAGARISLSGFSISSQYDLLL